MLFCCDGGSIFGPSGSGGNRRIPPESILQHYRMGAGLWETGARNTFNHLGIRNFSVVPIVLSTNRKGR